MIEESFKGLRTVERIFSSTPFVVLTSVLRPSYLVCLVIGKRRTNSIKSTEKSWKAIANQS